MSPNMVGFSFIILGVFLILGKITRFKTKWLKRLFLPSSIIAGFLALLVGPQVLGRLTSMFLNESSFFYNGLIPEFILDTWSPLPGMFINIVFAALFLGQKVPTMKRIWNNSGPQIIMGYAVSFGQYAIGLLLTLLVLSPLFGTNPMAGALIEVAFVGGHGTAAGLASTFNELGFAEGADLALGLATVGILVGVITGIAIINIFHRKGEAKYVEGEKALTDEERDTIADTYGYEMEQEIKEPKAIEPLAFHLSLVGGAILIGYIIQQALVWLEAATWGPPTDVYVLSFVPLFPLAMIGGMVIQKVFELLDIDNYIDPNLVNKISGFALDVLLVSALATLSLDVIGDNLIPFVLLAIAGTAWTTFAFLYLGPRMLPDHWLERGVGDYGQYMGMAATGLLLMKVADPDQQSPALEGFGYKQILFEPVLGGGLVTSASLPLIYQFGPWVFLAITGTLTLIFVAFGLYYFSPKRSGQRESTKLFQARKRDN
ncbi:sodium/glutamate symporter [Alkalibacterium sp. MB6]|uniref:sodium/glutamate symporter n=1 Tax=Alkalibacterium sp. MB6 TaxID=2081965 RepID=UPI0013796357|nr:sodium/glutamate symporter [Alkalibacterium sp. MB6]